MTVRGDFRGGVWAAKDTVGHGPGSSTGDCDLVTWDSRDWSEEAAEVPVCEECGECEEEVDTLGQGGIAFCPHFLVKPW